VVKTIGWVARAVVIGALAVVGCEAPAPSASPTPFADRPGIQIDPTWRSVDGEWTFTGRVDPKGDPTDVVLEVGPGLITARQFDRQLPVARDLTEARGR